MIVRLCECPSCGRVRLMRVIVLPDAPIIIECRCGASWRAIDE